MPALKDSPDLRQQIIDTCHQMVDAGLIIGTAGNVSVRVTDGMLVTPTAVPYDQMTPDGLCKISVTEPPSPTARPKPTSEWAFHQAVMRTRRDVMAVVHAHPPFATAIATQRRGLEAIHYMIAAFGGNSVPVVDYALFGSTALAGNVARAVAKRHACLLANHGALAVGNSLEQALWRMVELEGLAKVDTYARMSGTPVVLSDEEIQEVLVAFDSYKPT